jgi:hypothetical protein
MNATEAHYRATLAAHPALIGFERREQWAMEVTLRAARVAGFIRWTDPATLARGMGCTLIVEPVEVFAACGGVVAHGRLREQTFS